MLAGALAAFAFGRRITEADQPEDATRTPAGHGLEGCATGLPGRPAPGKHIKPLLVHLLLTFLSDVAVINRHHLTLMLDESNYEPMVAWSWLGDPPIVEDDRFPRMGNIA
jgi:hypothetical protein